MTTEREQLELAAKACGYVIERWMNDSSATAICGMDKNGIKVWEPLHDDGDCARMEAALGIDVEWEIFTREVWSSCGNVEIMERFKDYDGDKNAARRAASVAVAAEIGRMV